MQGYENRFTVLRDGNGRNLVQSFGTLRAALTQIGHSIVDNGFGTKAQAQRFAATVRTGSPAFFGPYVFTLIDNQA